MLKSNARRLWGRVLTGTVAVSALSGCFQNRPILRAADGTLAPTHAGVFVSAADYEAGRLTSAAPCEAASRPIARDAFRNSPLVELSTTNGSVAPTRYVKSEVFGFRACDGSEWRFVGGENYRVDRAAPLYLYERERRVSVGKGSRLVYDHFFSPTAADSARPLTLLSLKAAFPTNHHFHDLLDLAFRSDEELMRFDDFHHEYRVARLLRETLP